MKGKTNRYNDKLPKTVNAKEKKEKKITWMTEDEKTDTTQQQKRDQIQTGKRWR